MRGFRLVQLRGIEVRAVPTTVLLELVDASVGGKTVVDFLPAGKNLVGAFHQPRAVVADLGSFPRCPWREQAARSGRSGQGGIDRRCQLLARIEADAAADRIFTLVVLTLLSPPWSEVKVEVVTADEREAGRRATLNFGHTIGHAILRVIWGMACCRARWCACDRGAGVWRRPGDAAARPARARRAGAGGIGSPDRGPGHRAAWCGWKVDKKRRSRTGLSSRAVCAWGPVRRRGRRGSPAPGSARRPGGHALMLLVPTNRSPALGNASERGREHGCEALQIFARPKAQWAGASAERRRPDGVPARAPDCELAAAVATFPI